MASRLSEESLQSAYDRGHQSFSVQAPPPSLEPWTGKPVDLKALLDAPNPRAAIQALPTQSLYHALLQRGAEDSLEVLEYISRDQAIRLCDYDGWHEDRLEPKEVFKWLKLYKEISPKHMYLRFRQLDEEYQLALLQPYIAVYDQETYDELSAREQDELTALPCGTLYYRIHTDDTFVNEAIESLIKAACDSDMTYVYSLLAHATYMPPNEQEALIAQFRKARLEEDGFCSYEESLGAFLPVDLESLQKKWADPRAVSGAASLEPVTEESEGETLFLTRLLRQLAGTGMDVQAQETLSRGLAFLANKVCSATGVTPEDMHGFKRVVQQTHALVSLGTEYLADGREERGLELLAREHPQILFRTGLTLAHRVQRDVLDRLVDHGILSEDTGVRRLWQQDRRGALLTLLDREVMPVLGFERTETLKGLFNRFPLCPRAYHFASERARAAGEASERVTFVPVDSRKTLRQLIEAVNVVCGLTYVASLASGGRPVTDLDRILSTGLLRVLCGGDFDAAPLDEQTLDAFVSLDEATRTQRRDDYLQGLEGTLGARLLDREAGTTWAVSPLPKIRVADPTQGALKSVRDLLEQIEAARALAREQEMNRPVAGMVETQPQREESR